ncbi:MAG: gamma-glutamyl-gamma-aminobutyrate hydrolase family protein [Clostridiales bacterium]|nr:gamma-glutamyl-gamma-aminobutyrate hydrolase family protein [Clostridiales bacterium]MCF8023335.1 gamma-glutamyl-gamma-aminobutyrate hydrolase family protein [Clostridiales bacterium]
MRPLIGITCSQDDNSNSIYTGRDYMLGVEKAGGVPVLLPAGDVNNIKYLLEVLHGIVFSGGGDIDPHFFGEEPLPATGEVDPRRDEYELELAHFALAYKKPCVGICRGMQVLNVAAGGTVSQDINLKILNPLKHFQRAPRPYPSHSIKIEKNTWAALIFKNDVIRVNSFHHQVIGSLAPGFKISARSPDGVEEIIEYTGEDEFVLGVQFHPENMLRQNTRFLELFSMLVQQGKYKYKRE